MYIESLATYNYRNLSDQNIVLHPGVNFVIGKNGQGKTNFIEAISLLSRGRSFRTSKQKELIKSEQKESSVFANIVNDGQTFNLGIALKAKEKEYYFNQDKQASLKDFISKLISISFTPDDLTLIKEGPQERRNFLDKHILDIRPSYIDAVFSYQRALKNKNNILKNNSFINKNEIIPWNQILAQAAVQMMKERSYFVRDLGPKVSEYYNIFASQESNVTLQIKNTYLNYKDINQEDILKAFEENIEREISQRSCLIGVHKDELEVNLNGKHSRFYASQGETRSLVLALKISVLDQIENTRKINPVLLLDDVDSELDSSRKQALADIIFAKERQIIITGTQLPHFEQQKSGNFFVFNVSEGNIRRTENDT